MQKLNAFSLLAILMQPPQAGDVHKQLCTIACARSYDEQEDECAVSFLINDNKRDVPGWPSSINAKSNA